MQIFKTTVIIIVIASLVSCVAKRKKERELLFQATYDQGVGGCSLALYKDSTCLWFGGIGTDDIEGTYQKIDSLIVLQNIPLDGCLKSNKLVLTMVNPNNSSLHDHILVQVDSRREVIDSMHIFTIVTTSPAN
jgi:hypothetical protein